MGPDPGGRGVARSPLHLSDGDRQYEAERTMARVRIGAALFYTVAAGVRPGDDLIATVAIGALLAVVAAAAQVVVSSGVTPPRWLQFLICGADCAVLLLVLANNLDDPNDAVYMAAAIVVLEGGMRWAVPGGIVVGALMGAGVGLWTLEVAMPGQRLAELLTLRIGVLVVIGWGVGTIVRTMQEQSDALRLAFAASHDAMLAVDADGRIVTANVAAVDLLDRDGGGLVGASMTDIVVLPRDKPRLDTGRRAGFRVRLPTPPGVPPRELTLELTPLRQLGLAYVVCRDVTDAVAAEAELSRHATTDPLTGLMNRRHLETQLRAWAGRERASTLLFVDLDDFKPVNDRYGHAVGDELLRIAAARLRTCVRDGELLARYGGDEFCVVVEGGDPAAADSVVARIVDAIREPFAVEGGEVTISCSVGVAVRQPGETAEGLLRRADAAMYDVKRRGGDGGSHLRVVG